MYECYMQYTKVMVRNILVVRLLHTVLSSQDIKKQTFYFFTFTSLYKNKTRKENNCTIMKNNNTVQRKNTAILHYV